MANSLDHRVGERPDNMAVLTQPRSDPFQNMGDPLLLVGLANQDTALRQVVSDLLVLRGRRDVPSRTIGTVHSVVVYSLLHFYCSLAILATITHSHVDTIAHMQHILKSSSALNYKKEKSSRIRKASTIFAIVVIALVLLFVPWLIYQFIPAVSAFPGYTGESKCVYPYTNEILIGAVVVVSIVSKIASRLLIKGPAHWKVFLLFEVVLLVSTVIFMFLNQVLCAGHLNSF